ncbi:hypothetical protein, partial [Undibacterium sp. 10I3]|uniref:hypothetical protein n=1 Tax=Undibacterium sp. 10I3 TaxID=3048579 RepID=UPI002B2225A4
MHFSDGTDRVVELDELFQAPDKHAKRGFDVGFFDTRIAEQQATPSAAAQVVARQRSGQHAACLRCF